MLLNIIMVSSLRTIFLSGQISVAHAAFVGCGAYFAGVLAKQFALAPWITTCGSSHGDGAWGPPGIPFTRVRAIYFAMVSLFGGSSWWTSYGLPALGPGAVQGSPKYHPWPRARGAEGSLLLLHLGSYHRLPDHSMANRAQPSGDDVEGHRPVAFGGIERRYQRGLLQSTGFGRRLFFCGLAGACMPTST